jgi:hypothetical protein
LRSGYDIPILQAVHRISAEDEDDDGSNIEQQRKEHAHHICGTKPHGAREWLVANKEYCREDDNGSYSNGDIAARNQKFWDFTLCHTLNYLATKLLKNDGLTKLLPHIL